MTEYTTSPEAYGEYMSARERTAYWVQAHSSRLDPFYSPSVPPSEFEEMMMPSSPPSEAGSSHSMPPKMVLKFSDGRPDVPITYANGHLPPHRRVPGNYGAPHGHPYPPSQYHSHMAPSAYNPHPMSPIHAQSRHHAPRSGSHSSNPSGSYSRPHELPGAAAGSPEEIRVLPSRAPSGPLPAHSLPAPSHHQRSHHHRSKSLSRGAADIEPLPAAPPHLGYPHHSHAGPQVNFAPGHPPWAGVHSSNGSGKHSHGHSAHKVPPAIVYAPSHQRGHPRYAPPAILHYQPQRGPNGMIYSHSAPVPIQSGPYPTPIGATEFAERGRRDRARSLGPGVVHKIPRSNDGDDDDDDDDDDARSNGSGSTYYVLPTPGQKVHVISPSPEQSVVTATSTTKSPSSPRKPFFRRLFNFAKMGSSTGGSSRGTGRKLRRRHSTGDSGRPRAPIDPALESEVPE